MKNLQYISSFNEELKLKGFKVFQIESDNNPIRAYSRKDFFKICLTTGKSKIHYADRTYEADGTILFFGNPHIPYSWETISSTYVGYTCLFSETFFNKSELSLALQKSPLFEMGGTPILNISESQRTYLNSIFSKMIEEQSGDYLNKAEVIRNQINLILHEANKLQPSENYFHKKDASQRLTTVFLELLERQFPIEVIKDELKLKTPKDYASSLHVHINHLNYAVKKITGKSTSLHIANRVILEAKSLLHNSDWNISDISLALGFEYPSYFANYFKKYTGHSPSEFRDKNI
jgi:AraC family transcriptional regulator, transcriptional activator of pobA